MPAQREDPADDDGDAWRVARGGAAPTPDAPGRGPWMLPAGAVVLLVGTLLLVAFRLGPPTPLPASAAPSAFSAVRARGVLERLVPHDVPHPAGSAENAAVRERLKRELTALGLTPEEQHDLVCGRFGVCAPVTNVVAELPGRSDRAIGLFAHYDSVPAGPGGADDGFGVASLVELARALQHGAPRERSVLLVFTDAEEVGMLGGQLFAQRHPARGRLDFAINLEARGIRGPSLLFRTSPNATELIAAYTAVPRPVATSLAQEVFARLPNDTDLSELLATGVAGYDLAFIGGAAAYHTPLDATAHVSLGSVQHQGSNALALLHALDQRPKPDPRRAGSVFFDVGAAYVVAWPATAALPLACGGSVLLLLALAGLVARRAVSGVGLALGALLWLVTLVLVAIASFAIHLVVRHIGAVPFMWVAYPGALHLVIGALAALAALAAAWLARRIEPAELALGSLLGWATLAVVTAAWLPGGSYLFFVPVAAGALAALGWVLIPGAKDVGTGFVELLPLAFAALVVWPVVLHLYAAVGFVALPVNAVVVALVVTLSSAALSRLSGRIIAWGAGGATVGLIGGLVLAAALPATTSTAPRWVSLAYEQQGDAPARWLADVSFGPLPPAIAAAAPFRAAGPYPWAGAPLGALEAPATSLRLVAPALDSQEAHVAPGFRRLRFVARSRRGAQSLSLHLLDGRPVDVTIDGRTATPVRIGGYRVVAVFGVPPAGVAMEVSVADGKPLTGLLVDHTAGLPESGAFLARERARSASAAHFGDASVVGTPFTL